MTLKRFILVFILLLAGTFSCLTYYPDVFFSDVLNTKFIAVHSKMPLDISETDMLGRISDKLAADDFFDPKQKFELYLGDDYGQYSFLAPFCRKTYACLHPLTGKVFVALTDLKKNLAYGPGAAPKTRMLENVITHELVKAQLLNKLGTLPYVSLHEWQTDGYAEHIAMETADADTAIICPGAQPEDPRAPYLKDKLVLEAVKQENDLAYKNMMDNDRSGDEALKHVMQRYCQSN